MTRDGEIAQALLEEAKRLGVKAELEKTRRHNAVVLSSADRVRRYIFAGTTSDWRSRKNAITGLRRTVRELLSPGC